MGNGTKECVAVRVILADDYRTSHFAVLVGLGPGSVRHRKNTFSARLCRSYRAARMNDRKWCPEHVGSAALAGSHYRALEPASHSKSANRSLGDYYAGEVRAATYGEATLDEQNPLPHASGEMEVPRSVKHREV